METRSVVTRGAGKEGQDYKRGAQGSITPGDKSLHIRVIMQNVTPARSQVSGWVCLKRGIAARRWRRAGAQRHGLLPVES